MTRIFADTADVNVIKKLIEEGIQLDGVTTNPSLFKKVYEGRKFSEEELDCEYIKLLNKIRVVLPNGSISGEIYVDMNTDEETILKSARKMASMVRDIYIKIPITKNGLKAAGKYVKEGGKINMTLCFNQNQAMAIAESINENIPNDSVFISPFVGRLFDKGLNGYNLINNITKMYKDNNIKIKVLAASIRTLEQFKWCLDNNIDIVTAPPELLLEWNKNGFDNLVEDKGLYEPIEYKVDENYPIDDPMTESGINKFVEDRKALC